MNKLKLIFSDKILFLALIFVTLFSTAVVYTCKLESYPPIRSDAVGLYAYLPSIFIYKDITMRSLLKDQIGTQEEIDKFFEGEIDGRQMEWYGISKYQDKYIDKYPIGSAILMAPSFFAAHGLTVITNQEANGFSSWYQIFIALQGIVYFLLGILVLRRFLLKFFTKKIVYFTLFALIFGTQLFHYSTYDSIFTHVQSFFLFTLFLTLSHKWHKKMTVKNSILLGLISGLIVAVRPTNGVFIVTFILYNIYSLQTFKDKFRFLFHNTKHLLIIGLAAFSIIFWQLLYWHEITGNWIVHSYRGENFNFANPQILNVLFSLNAGIFFWVPLLFLAIIGIAFMRKNIELKKYIVPTITYLIVHTYIVSSWWAWSFGGFAHRAFTESLAILSLPLAALYSYTLRNQKLRKYIIALALVLIALTMFYMANYWLHLIPIDQKTPEIYLRMFTRPFEKLFLKIRS